MKTDALQSSRHFSSLPDSGAERSIGLAKVFRAAAVVAVLGCVSLANAAIVVNGDFELVDTGPADALGWTGENGINILRTASGGVGGSAGGLISNTGVASAAGPLTQNTAFAGGEPVSGGQSYTFSVETQRTFTNGGVFQIEVIARDEGNAPIGGSVINSTLTLASSGFETFSQSFLAPAGTTRFQINFFAITGADLGSASSVVVDNVQIVVPEPSTGALLLAGVVLSTRRRSSSLAR